MAQVDTIIHHSTILTAAVVAEDLFPQTLQHVRLQLDYTISLVQPITVS